MAAPHLRADRAAPPSVAPTPDPKDWLLPQQARWKYSRSSSREHGSLRVEGGAGCRGSEEHAPRLRQQLLRSLFRGRDPFHAVDPARYDHGYPHSNLRASFVKAVLETLGAPADMLWLEVGSFVGNSAILTASVAAHACMRNMTIVVVDPFTGDVNMWDWQQLASKGRRHLPFGYDFLALDASGRPTIRDRFMSNVAWAGAAPWVVPITAPGVVGMRLLGRLLKSFYHHGLVAPRPSVLYLDSAHEAGETLTELRVAFDLLADGGVLFGDDWAWKAVRADVAKFAAYLPNATALERQRWSTAASRRASFSAAGRRAGLKCEAPRVTGSWTLWTTRLLVCEPGGTWVVFKP